MRVKNTVERLPQGISAFEAYRRLKKYHAAQDLFLLESLSGPERALRKALLAVNPLLHLQVKGAQLHLSGHPLLCQHVKSVLAASPLLKNLCLIDLQDLFAVLRLIESCFSVDYQEGFDFDYRFGFFGYFGYDAIQYIEKIQHKIAASDEGADVALSLYQSVLYVDLKTQASYWIQNHFEGIRDFDCTNLRCLEPEADILDQPVPVQDHVQDSITEAAYLKAVDQALHHIALGDIYQIQLGHTIAIDSPIDPFVVYQRMRAKNPSPYMYFVEIGEKRIIGASPELCVNLRENCVTIRPLAGTIRRGKTSEEDQILKDTLRNDPKEQAEHIMLVDLARNDVSRVCQVNTLKVTELMVIEAYSHVFHLVSNVLGKLAAGLDHYDVIAASFPAGTLTGAPKIRAMELIEAMETSRRGIYGGCLGFIDFRGNTEMAICIRTAFYQGGRYSIRASAGIVVDSIAEKEWQETLVKLGSSYYAITGKELK
ncbi:MAG: anthranilate synthase component I family protein [Gammaproteobacteria bacterium]|nr:anthranilate synthase component I family protein [Gammaproteobacteria bacterium]